jgi:hypothetical protein
VSHDDPESWLAHPPCSVRSESRCIVGAPRPPSPTRHKHKAFGCVAQPALASPSGGRDFPPAIAQRALFLLSLVLGPTLLSLLFLLPSRHSARQPTGVPQLALLLS